VKNLIDFEIPFQDCEQYHAGRTKQRGRPQVAHVCLIIQQMDEFVWYELHVCHMLTWQ